MTKQDTDKLILVLALVALATAAFAKAGTTNEARKG